MFANDQKSASQCDSGISCKSEVPVGDSKFLKSSNHCIFKRHRRRFRNGSKKPSNDTTSNDQALRNLTTEYTNRGNASSEMNASTSASDSTDRNDPSSDSKSEFIKKRRRGRRRRASKKTRTPRTSLVASNVADYSQST